MSPPRRARHVARSQVPFAALAAALVLVTGAVVVWRLDVLGRDGPEASAGPSASSTPREATTPGPINTAFPAITTFRGNAERSYYGQGPVPGDPVVLWRYPSSGALCSESTAGGEAKEWCGTGWTGQPNVIVHPGGAIEVRIGAYDRHYHFLAGRTGQPVRPIW